MLVTYATDVIISPGRDCRCGADNTFKIARSNLAKEEPKEDNNTNSDKINKQVQSILNNLRKVNILVKCYYLALGMKLLSWLCYFYIRSATDLFHQVFLDNSPQSFNEINLCQISVLICLFISQESR